jgi:hypothetical protein
VSTIRNFFLDTAATGLRPSVTVCSWWRRRRTDHLAKLRIDDGLDIAAIAAALMLTDPDSVERRLRRDMLAHRQVTDVMGRAVFYCPFPRPCEVLHRTHSHSLPLVQTVPENYATIANWKEGWERGRRLTCGDGTLGCASTPAWTGTAS